MLKRVFLTCSLSFLAQSGPWKGPKPGFLFSWALGRERQEEGLGGQLQHSQDFFSFQPSSKTYEG